MSTAPSTVPQTSITIGSGRTNPHGSRRVLSPLPGALVSGLADVLRDLPEVADSWWAPHTWKGDRRTTGNWWAAAALVVDVDYHDGKGKHVAPTREVGARLEQAARAGKLGGNLFHLTPHGARVVFVLEHPVTDPDRCRRAIEGACAKVQAALATHEGYAVDEGASTDLARLFFAPRAIVNGERRTAEVLVLSEAPCTSNELAAAAPSSENGAAPRQAPPIERRIGAERNNKLTSIAGSMRRRGCSHEGILAALRVENKLRCDPPLEDAELEGIAKSISTRYQPEPLHVPKFDPELDAGASPAAERRFTDAAVDAATFAAQELPAAEVLLGNGPHRLLCAGDVALFFGRPGIGKTWLGLGLARAVATGEPWFGFQTPTGGAPVGLLELELPADELQHRVLAVAGHETSRLNIVCRPPLVGPVDLDTPEDHAALKAWIKRDGLKLLVVDALVRAHGLGEGEESLKPLLLWLEAVARETGCAILVLHHERKGSSEQNGRHEQDHLDAARGHSMLTSFPMLCMRIYQHGPARALAFPKVTRGPEPDPIYFRLGSNGLPEPCDPPELASKAKGEANRTLVLKALVEGTTGGPVAVEAVVNATRLSPSTVHAHLKALVRDGKVREVRAGKALKYLPTFRPSEQGHSEAGNPR